MEILFVLIPLSIGLAATGLAGFFWAVNDGQYEDLDREARRVFDDGGAVRDKEYKNEHQQDSKSHKGFLDI